MAKKSKENPILEQVLDHYVVGKDDNDIRRTREKGWNDVLKGYFGVLPEGFPYLAQVVDPLIRTTILEKTSRLFNGRLSGTLSPRKGGTEIGAKVNNAILEFQWDSANNGGSMLEKWALMDMQTRLFGASFGLCHWSVTDEYEGNEFKLLDNRDVFVDYTATHIKNANWVQVREWKSIEDLEAENANNPEPIYENLKVLRDAVYADKNAETGTGDRRDSEYESMIKNLRGLEDRVGTDKSFPTLEIVTEYRKDRWITFSPKLGIILRDIPNPRDYKCIPIVQLRYYPSGDDVYGESEVESVLPIWLAIEAVLNGAIDEINLRMKPPIKVSNAETVRLDTIEYGPNAIWLVGSSQQNVTEMQGGGDIINNFQAMYSALKQAYNSAMGEMSQGVGVADPFNPEKTATEVRSSESQKRSRDQYNQLYLEQALKDMMMIWLSNNRQFLFSDPTQRNKVIEIIGRPMLKELQEIGLNDTVTDPSGIKMLKDLIVETEGEITDSEMSMIFSESQIPKHPIIMNPEEKDYSKWDIKPKLDMEGETGKLYVEPEDMEGLYDYTPSVRSLSIDSSENQKAGRLRAFDRMSNPQIQQQLLSEGEKLKIKEILVDILEDEGLQNANKYFEKAETPQPTGIGAGQESGQAIGLNEAGGMAGLVGNPNIGGEGIVPQS